MITNSEIQISNRSYINKDFQTIYPELLDLVKSLTNKWDPSTSNESDPGVILLKLAAFVADKNNYNIDKNLLECFMPSCTQESSMRRLCEMNGYSPAYYRAATVPVVGMYTGDQLTVDGQACTVTLKKFETTITDSEKALSFVLLGDLTFDARNVSTASVQAMQGVIQDLSVNGNTLIQLTDLDGDNRIYFPEVMVAENGIFVMDSEAGTSLWTMYENLNDVTLGTKAYKFGLDSSLGLPYIEFPSDIATLINKGIYIKYIVTDGYEGNIAAGTLTQVLNKTEVDYNEGLSNVKFTIDNNLVITNTAASINGSDPETLEEAYNSYKKSVGTFNTLVSRRDYENAIYNLIDSDLGTYHVSNVYVGDRASDINYSSKVSTLDEMGTVVRTIPEPGMSANNLIFYALTPVTAITGQDSYEKGFKPLIDQASLEAIELDLDDVKCIAHDYKYLDNGKIHSILNKYKLNVNITTKSKVPLVDQLSIKKNVHKALYKAFSARNVDFGYEVPYDTLYEVIQNSDPRIESFSLAEPEYSAYAQVIDKTGTATSYKQLPLDVNTVLDGYDIETDVKDYNYLYGEMVKNSVKAGTLSLYDYDADFEIEFGQTNAATARNVETVSTYAKIPLNKGGIPYVVQKNEYIQLVAPNTVTSLSYSYGVLYSWNSQETVAKDQLYKLGDNDKLYIRRTANNTVLYEEYGVGTIIKPNFRLIPTPTSNDIDQNTTGVSVIERDWKGVNSSGETELSNKWFASVGANEQLDILKLAEKVLNSGTAVPCYWIVNNADGKLFADGITDRILDTNEYFIMSDNSYTEFVVYGSGTKLHRDTNDESWVIFDYRNTVKSIEDIQRNGLSAFDKSDWVNKNFKEHNLTISEMQILTLSEGSKIRITGGEAVSGEDNGEGNLNLNNAFNRLNYSYAYQLSSNDEEVSIPMPNVEDLRWSIRSRLDLRCSPDTYQELYSGHTVEVYGKNAAGVIVKLLDIDRPGYRILANCDVDLTGGEGVNAYVVNTLTGEMGPHLHLRKYEYSPIVFDDVIYTRVGDYINLPAFTSNHYEQIIRVTIDADSKYIIPAVLKNNGSVDVSVIIKCGDTLQSTVTSENSVSFVLRVGESLTKNIYIKNTSSESVQYFTVEIADKDSDNSTPGMLASSGTIVLVPAVNTETGATIDGVSDIESGLGIINTDSTDEANYGILNADEGVDLMVLGGASEGANVSISFGTLNRIKGYNPAILKSSTLSAEDKEDLLDAWETEINNSGTMVHHVGTRTALNLIEMEDFNSALTLWNPSHVYNRVTIAQFDTINSTIEIARTSRL